MSDENKDPKNKYTDPTGESEEHTSEEEQPLIHLTRLDEEGLEEFKTALSRSDREALEEVYNRYEPIDFAQADRKSVV